MATVYVQGDVPSQQMFCWMEVQNFNRVPHVTIIAHNNLSHVLTLNKMQSVHSNFDTMDTI